MDCRTPPIFRPTFILAYTKAMFKMSITDSAYFYIPCDHYLLNKKKLCIKFQNQMDQLICFFLAENLSEQA